MVFCIKVQYFADKSNDPTVAVWLLHLNIKTCHFVALVETTDAVVDSLALVD